MIIRAPSVKTARAMMIARLGLKTSTQRSSASWAIMLPTSIFSRSLADAELSIFSCVSTTFNTVLASEHVRLGRCVSWGGRERAITVHRVVCCAN